MTRLLQGHHRFASEHPDNPGTAVNGFVRPGLPFVWISPPGLQNLANTMETVAEEEWHHRAGSGHARDRTFQGSGLAPDEVGDACGRMPLGHTPMSWHVVQAPRGFLRCRSSQVLAVATGEERLTILLR